MTNFDLYQATGLTPQELSEVFQHNPRAYMAVRGAVAEKHLEKIVCKLKQDDLIQDYRTASGDMDKDFYLNVGDKSISLECKNVEVIKTSTKSSRLDYISYVAEQGYLSSERIDHILDEIKSSSSAMQDLNSSELSSFFKKLPQEIRESGLAKYEFSSSKVDFPKIGQLPDCDYLQQFSEFPITIDFQRTRNSTDDDGDTRRNRYYRVGEIDIVAACLFSRTMEWKFLYAKAENFSKHKEYKDRYSNKLILEPGIWTSDLMELIGT